jgi:hypothetical protein
LTASQKVQFAFYLVIPAPYQVRDKLQQESRDFSLLWTPASAGVTRFLTFYKTDKSSFILRVLRGYICFGCGSAALCSLWFGFDNNLFKGKE